MSLPVVLVRHEGDVVPVVLGLDGNNELAGYDIVRERVVPVAAGDVDGAVSTNPAAVYFGMDLVENEERGRRAAEAHNPAFFYHWTHVDALPSIRQHGLRPGQDGLYVTDDSEAWAAFSRVVHNRHQVLLRFPRSAVRPRLIDKSAGEHAFVVHQTVSPDVIEFEPEQDGYWEPIAASASEPDHSCFPCGLQDAQEDRGPRVSLEEFAATFLANVESDGDPHAFRNDPRTERIARTLEALDLRSVGKILGAGTFGTAAILNDDTVIKLTSDPTEVQAGAVLRGKRLKHVVRIHDSYFIRGVRAKTFIGQTESGKKITRRYPVGVLYTERVTPIEESWAANQLSVTVNTVKQRTKTYPDDLAQMDREEQRALLKKASNDLEGILRYQAKELRTRGDGDDASLAEGVADALHELRDHGVYAIDVHEGNVGYVDTSSGRLYKVYDVGSSSPPARPRAPVVDDSETGGPEQLWLPGVLEAGAGAAEWIGDGVDALEPAGSQNPTYVDAGAEEARKLTSAQAAKAISEIPMFRGARHGDPHELTGPSYFSSAEVFAKTYGPTAEFRLKLSKPLVVSNEDWPEFASNQFNPIEDVVANVQAAGRGYDSAVNVRRAAAGPLYTVFLLDPSKASLVERVAYEAAKPPPKFEPQGAKFAPVNLPLFGDLPVITGYTQVRAQLERHRAEVPSVETIVLSTVFSGLTIMVGIAQAERQFACVARMYERLGRTRMPTLAEIQDCLLVLGLHEQRAAMYETAGAWAPIVRDAMKSGARDRKLRRLLYLETELPVGIGIAKLSFILALCGQDTICLDARLLGRMFGHADGKKMSSSFNAQRSEATLSNYESVEDAFLADNPFYDPKDPIGRARAQWISWEQSGKPPKPASHSVWLRVIR